VDSVGRTTTENETAYPEKSNFFIVDNLTRIIMSPFSALPMQRSDDFLIPSNVDNDQHCDRNSDVTLNNVLLPIGGALSLLCYAYLMWMYFVVKSPILMRHPTSKCGDYNVLPIYYMVHVMVI
jgi:hypothetical protein